MCKHIFLSLSLSIYIYICVYTCVYIYIYMTYYDVIRGSFEWGTRGGSSSGCRPRESPALEPSTFGSQLRSVFKEGSLRGHIALKNCFFV